MGTYLYLCIVLNILCFIKYKIYKNTENIKGSTTTQNAKTYYSINISSKNINNAKNT
jgi:amino acid permease